jgi:hypothetical protein
MGFFPTSRRLAQEFSEKTSRPTIIALSHLVFFARSRKMTAMTRYQARKTAQAWSIFDRLTRETLPTGETGVSQVSARSLSDLLNNLEAQQEWSREAARWPMAAA